MRGSLGLSMMTLALAMVLSSVVRAQPAETSAAPPPAAPATADAQAPEPYAPPAASPTPYPAPYGQPPGYPAPYAQPPGYPPPVPYGYSPWAYYEEGRKSAGLAFLFEFLLPGIGSIYADHTTGAILTWGLLAGGMLLILNSIDTRRDPYTGYEESHLGGGAVVGILALVAGRTYGLIDAIVATGNYNARLRQRLGLGAMIGMGVAPTPSGSPVLVPSLRFTF